MTSITARQATKGRDIRSRFTKVPKMDFLIGTKS